MKKILGLIILSLLLSGCLPKVSPTGGSFLGLKIEPDNQTALFHKYKVKTELENSKKESVVKKFMKFYKLQKIIIVQ